MEKLRRRQQRQVAGRKVKGQALEGGGNHHETADEKRRSRRIQRGEGNVVGDKGATRVVDTFIISHSQR